MGLTVTERVALLARAGVDFQVVPAWQRRGVGLYWERVAREGRDGRTGEVVVTTRRRLTVDLELPGRAGYDAFIAGLVARADPDAAAPGVA